MKLSEIENKIAEYNLKLGKRTPVETRKGKILLRSIPGHLRAYICQEITKLEKEKEYIINQKGFEINCIWENVKFENGNVRLKINNHYTEPIKLPQSRQSFELLKPYLIKAKLKPISATIHGVEIKSIKNLDEILVVFGMLSLKDDINSYTVNTMEFDISNFNNKYSQLSNDDIFKFFKINERSRYLAILCDLQDVKYKIIPISEYSSNHLKPNEVEDSFLFSITCHDATFIVWESASINRATYVFEANDTNYLIQLQNIFNYILSYQTNKRRTLRKLIKTDENVLGAICVIEHDNIEDWNKKILTKIK